MSTFSRLALEEMDEELEHQLKISLRPVNPNPVFVQHLHTRLASPPAMTIERRNTALSLLLVAMAMVMGLFLIWLTHRLGRTIRKHHQPAQPLKGLNQS